MSDTNSLSRGARDRRPTPHFRRQCRRRSLNDSPKRRYREVALEYPFSNPAFGFLQLANLHSQLYTNRAVLCARDFRSDLQQGYEDVHVCVGCLLAGNAVCLPEEPTNDEK